MTDEESIRVQLARMEGKQDVANERLNAVQTEVTGLRERVHDHGNEIAKIQAERAVMVKDYHTRTEKTEGRLTNLEDWRSDVEGDRKSILTGGRVIVWVSGLIPGGVIVGGLMRLFGN